MTDALSQMKQQTAPNIQELLAQHKKDIEATFNAIQVGEIVSFDANTQSAQVKLVLKRIGGINPDGTRIYRNYPLLANCPTCFLFGGGSFVSLPIQPGDTCIVLFSDRDFSNWYVNGGTQPPAELRTHDLSDSLCIVGVKNLQNAISNYLANGIRIFFSGNSNMDFTDAQIKAITDLFLHQGNVHITGDLTIDGTTFGNGSNDWLIDANIRQQAGRSIHAGNGATGDFERVQVVDGIVISGS